MIFCPLCGAGLRDDSRFCDKCGVQLEARGYPAYYFQPFDLVLQAITYLVQTWDSLDIQQRIEILRLAGDAAAGTLLAMQRLAKWWESRKDRSRLDPRQWQ